MLKGLGDIGNLLKLQKQLKDMQKRMKKMETTVTGNGGWLTVTVNGEFEVVKISVDEKMLSEKVKDPSPSVIAREIQNTINNAVKTSKNEMAEKMKEITGGMNIPGLSDFM